MERYDFDISVYSTGMYFFPKTLPVRTQVQPPGRGGCGGTHPVTRASWRGRCGPPPSLRAPNHLVSQGAPGFSRGGDWDAPPAHRPRERRIRFGRLRVRVKAHSPECNGFQRIEERGYARRLFCWGDSQRAGPEERGRTSCHTRKSTLVVGDWSSDHPALSRERHALASASAEARKHPLRV